MLKKALITGITGQDGSYLAELLLALITDQPLSKAEKREVALHIMRLTRRSREAQGLSDDTRTKTVASPRRPTTYGKGLSRS